MRLEYDVSPVANLDIGERFYGTIIPTDAGCARRVVELHSNTVREGLNDPLYAADIMYEIDLAIRHETFRDIVHPINAPFRAMLENAVIAAYRTEYEAAKANAAAAEEAENVKTSEESKPELSGVNV